jgi:hypothetical protein
MDVNELRRMFSLSNHPPAAAARPKSSKPTVPTLLPVNRANIIQIFVTHLKTDMTKLRTAIVTGSDDWLTLEDVCDIQKMVPNAEEISLIRGHKGDVRLLSVADQFVAVMASIPLLNEKLDALRFRKVREAAPRGCVFVSDPRCFIVFCSNSLRMFRASKRKQPLCCRQWMKFTKVLA